MAGYAASTADPTAYGRELASRLCPTTLPYEIGTAASFSRDRFNGRSLGEDVMDVVLALTANQPTPDGVTPDLGRIRAEFPYYGEPFTAEEQAGIKPAAAPAKK